MRRLVTMIGFAAVGAVLACGIGGMAVAEEQAKDGMAIFTASKCNMCHSVEAAGIEAKVKSEKMQGPDLGGVGSRHETDWIVQFVKKEVQLNENNHKGTFKGSDDDLKAIIAWLDGLQTEE